MILSFFGHVLRMLTKHYTKAIHVFQKIILSTLILMRPLGEWQIWNQGTLKLEILTKNDSFCSYNNYFIVTRWRQSNFKDLNESYDLDLSQGEQQFPIYSTPSPKTHLFLKLINEAQRSCQPHCFLPCGVQLVNTLRGRTRLINNVKNVFIIIEKFKIFQN